ncbi:MAG: type secretion outer membrane protein TolC family [Cyanobacteria bacterium RYN_339]|nr:type secretion outer membrane protein TolC family [Cyanobacteria bacterium RYN_339]
MLASLVVLALAAPPQPPLSLADAAALARTHSLGARAGRARLLGTMVQRDLLTDNTWPTISLGLTGQYTQLPADSPLLAFLGSGGGGLVGFPAPGAVLDTTIGAQQVLFDAFALHDSLVISDDQIAMGRLQIAQAEADAMGAAAVAYFAVLKAEGLAEVATTSVKQAQEHLRLGGERLKAGSGTRAEVLTQRANLASAQGNLITARNQANLARLQLDKALDTPVSGRTLVKEPDVPDLNLDIDQELAAGLTRRPEVQTQALKQHLDEARASLEGRAYWPTFTGNTSWAQRGLYQGQFLAAVNMRWNLFDGFKTRDKIAAAKADADSDAIALEEARQDIALEVRQQAQARQEARDRIAIAREGLAAADEAYRISIQRFKLGFSTNAELLDSRVALTSARNTYIQAQHDLRVAQIRLAKALGVDMATYLGASR